MLIKNLIRRGRILIFLKDKIILGDIEGNTPQLRREKQIICRKKFIRSYLRRASYATLLTFSYVFIRYITRKKLNFLRFLLKKVNFIIKIVNTKENLNKI